MGQDSFYWVFTPLNVTLFVVFLTLLFLRFRPSAPIELPNAPPATVFRTFTPRTLLPNNGTNDKPVYLAVKGKVYDVTPGRNFYGPGGPYENFAGRDATRGLACQSFDEEMLTKDLDGPLDTCEDLEADQIENLNGWVERFDEKVGLLGRRGRRGKQLLTGVCSTWWLASSLRLERYVATGRFVYSRFTDTCNRQSSINMMDDR